MAEERAPSKRPVSRRLLILSGLVVLVVLAVLAGVGSFLLAQHGGTTSSPRGVVRRSRAVATTAPTIPPTTTTTTSTLPPPGPGFVAGHITAVGDSVMLDYQGPLQADLPGISVDASVSRQWSDGVQVLQALKASGQLGAEIIVGLGSNGPITDSDFDAMMQTLNGASRVVFVNTHVDRDWQDPNNTVLATGATRYRNVVIADWATLAAQNPEWFGSDGTHLPIGGPGAIALAALVTSKVTSG